MPKRPLGFETYAGPAPGDLEDVFEAESGEILARPRRLSSRGCWSAGAALNRGASSPARMRETCLEHAQTVQCLAPARGLMVSLSGPHLDISSQGIATLTGAIPNCFLAGEKVLSERISWFGWFRFAFPISLVTWLLAYLVLHVRYVRRLTFAGISRKVLEQEQLELLNELGPLFKRASGGGAALGVCGHLFAQDAFRNEARATSVDAGRLSRASGPTPPEIRSLEDLPSRLAMLPLFPLPPCLLPLASGR